MHTLGDQWIEVINRQEHMVKVVEQAKTINADVCGGCYFGVCGDICHDGALHVCGYGEGKCPLDNVDWVIKDLGLLNEEGCLPEERTGLYPEIEDVKNRTFIVSLRTDDVIVICYGDTKQQAIDAWNRRA